MAWFSVCLEVLCVLFPVEVLKDVFQWLGFTVTVLLDQTAVLAREELKRFGDETHGDAFVCCVLSHGGKGVIYGTDDEPISTNDLFSPFKGTNCSTLIGKPKAFFIQACRVKDTQARVQLEADTNPGHQIYIPADADFLFAMATVEDYCSFRVPNQWVLVHPDSVQTAQTGLSQVKPDLICALEHQIWWVASGGFEWLEVIYTFLINKILQSEL